MDKIELDTSTESTGSITIDPTSLDLERVRQPLGWHLRQAICVAILCISDLFAVLLAAGAGFLQAGLLRKWLPLEELTIFGWAHGGGILFLFVASGYLLRGLYSRREPFWEQVRLTITTCSLMILLTVLALYLTKIGESTPRSLVLLAGLNLLLIAPITRLTTIRFLHAIGLWSRRVLIFGEEEASHRLGKDLEIDFALGYRVIGYRSFQQSDHKMKKIDEIIVCAKGANPNELSQFVTVAHRSAPSVTLIPELGFLPFGAGSSQFLFDSGRILLKSRNMLHARINLLVKRTFDLFAALFLTLLATPGMILVALAIRLDSKGTAFYLQTRIGRGGKKFRCIKFRTMHLDAEERLKKILDSDPLQRSEWERHYKLKTDPRITRMGGLLRKWSLDEVPQLLNVIIGTMSLVGPRPLPEYHHDRIEEPQRSDYLDVHPGITGLWQVSGRSDTDVKQMALLNSWYVRNWSLWLDVTLLLRTIPAVFSRKGAY